MSISFIMIYNFTTKLQKEKFRAPIVEDIRNNCGTRATLFFLLAAGYLIKLFDVFLTRVKKFPGFSYFIRHTQFPV